MKTGTKLFSPICGEVAYDALEKKPKTYIWVTDGRGYALKFDQYGRYFTNDGALCLLFPSKEWPVWEDYEKKQKYASFEDGDIIVGHREPCMQKYFFILKGSFNDSYFKGYVGIVNDDKITYDGEWNINNATFKYVEWGHATDKEKQFLLDTLKNDHKRWNPETKSIEDIPEGTLKTWENIEAFDGCYIESNSKTETITNCVPCDSSRDIAASEEDCKAMIAHAQISQILKRWYSPFTDAEWGDYKLPKYVIVGCVMNGNISYDTHYCTRTFLAFRSEADREEFVENNKELLFDYYMVRMDKPKRRGQ